MVNSSKGDAARLKAEILEALRSWYRSLPTRDAESKCVCASGVEYSPSEILQAVENETDFGKEFIAVLCAVQRRMRKKDPDASVIDLIRRGIVFETHASG